MSEYFPSLWEETDIQAQETQRIPKKRNPETSIPTDIIIKVSKLKERIFKAVREKQLIMYKGTPYMQIFQQKSCRPHGNGMPYSKY